MSRKIDLSKPLSDEDREYLLTRGRNDLIAQNDLDYKGGNDPKPIDDGNTGDINPFQADTPNAVSAGMTPEEMHGTPIAAVEGQNISDLGDNDKDPNKVATPPTPAPIADSEDDGDNYDDKDVWSYEDIKEEVKGRKEALEADSKEYTGPALNASREDLITWLREDDAADDSDDEETGEKTE